MMMTEDGLNEVGQMMQRMLPKGSAFILVIVPPHEHNLDHPLESCPVQTTCNINCTKDMASILRDTAEMFEAGTHNLLFRRPVEMTH